MSSSTVGIPTDSALRRLRSSVSPALSVSGMKMPSTFCGPNARAARAAQTLESTPPESATTAPRLRSCRPTVSFSRSTISPTTASASIASDSAVTLRRHRVSSVDEAADPLDRVEVVRQDLLVRDLDLVGRLEKLDQLQHAGRVDHTGLDQRVASGELRPLVGERKVLRQEVSDVAFDRRVVHVPRLGGSRGEPSLPAALGRASRPERGLSERPRLLS